MMSARTGRSVWTGVTRGALRPERLCAFARDREHGAVALFEGDVRASNRGRKVISVDYDGFRPLTERVLAGIAVRAGARWGARVAVWHRLGTLRVGQASVAVAAGAAHRAEAFGACREVIEAVKHRLPVWKLERYSDGGRHWLRGHGLRAGNRKGGGR